MIYLQITLVLLVFLFLFLVEKKINKIQINVLSLYQNLVNILNKKEERFKKIEIELDKLKNEKN